MSEDKDRDDSLPETPAADAVTVEPAAEAEAQASDANAVAAEPAPAETQREDSAQDVAEPAFAESVQDRDPEPTPRKNDSGARRLGGIALVLALLSGVGVAGLGAAGYLAQQRMQASETESATALRRSDELTRELRERLVAVETAREGLQRELALRDRDLGSARRSIEELTERLGATEAAVTRVSRAVLGGAASLQKAEIEHLLLIANDRILLAADVNGAIAALRLADERIAQVADPRLFPVRQKIAAEIIALQAVEQPDIQSLVLKLGSLAESSGRLVLRGGETPTFTSRRSTVKAPESAPPLERFMTGVKTMLSALFTVHRDETRHEPLMPPEQKYFLYQNLRLQIDAARLAVLDRDEASLRASLRSAESWLHQYFDTERPAAKSALETIATISRAKLAPPLPDLSGSLAALREELAGE